MQIGKKVALMAAAAAGTMVVGGAGSASAHGLIPNSDGVRQSNECEANLGVIAPVAGAAPIGDINPNPDCLNFTNGDSVFQSNECDTTTGPITPMGGATPIGDLDIGANCTNIAIDHDPVEPPKQHHKAKDNKHKAKHHKAKKHVKAKVKAKSKNISKAKPKAKKAKR